MNGSLKHKIVKICKRVLFYVLNWIPNSMKVGLFHIVFILSFQDLTIARLLLIRIIRSLAQSHSALKSLQFLLQLQNECYQLCGEESIRYGCGLHTKHRHIQYHNFFCKNIHSQENVLDIGCGNGFLDYHIVSKNQEVNILGVDCDQDSIDFARKHYNYPSLKFRVMDALLELPEGRFDCIILSNVLEHVEYRISFFKKNY